MKHKTIRLKKYSYTVIDSLKSGGQGSVWKVRRSDGVELALKVVLTNKADTNNKEHIPTSNIVSNKERLQNEIDFLKSINNSEEYNIVPCLDDGLIKDERYGDLPAWVMPLYGQTLEQRMPPYPNADDAPTILQCITWFRQVAVALNITHSFDIEGSTFIHRDVKPNNMMLTEKGEIRLIDYGIVRESSAEKEIHTVGHTIEHAAPEQILPSGYDANQPLFLIDSHIDIYCLGLVFYRLFTGASIKAQESLGSKDTYTKHVRGLDEGGLGLLGKIGGLEDDEYDLLKKEIEKRLLIEFGGDANANEGQTIVDSPNSVMTKHERLAKNIADYFRDQLLNPDYKKRPAAIKVIFWADSVIQELKPNFTGADDVSSSKNKPPVSADALWKKGKHQEALCIEFRESWLDELQQACKTIEQASRYGLLLKSLVECHPNKERTIGFRLKYLSEAFKQSKKTPKKALSGTVLTQYTGIFLKGILAVAIIVAIYFGLQLIRPSESGNQEIIQLQIDLDSRLSGARSSAWRRLNEMLDDPDKTLSNQASSILDVFKRDTYEMAQSHDTSKQKQAISRLHLIASNDNKKAMLMLAQAYHDGRGVEMNWGKTWQWYKTLNENAKQLTLEHEANTILNNKGMRKTKKDLAYQVVEKSANYQPAGDASQKWMWYRYKTGDGVKVDEEKARYWWEKFKGSTNLD